MKPLRESGNAWGAQPQDNDDHSETTNTTTTTDVRLLLEVIYCQT